MTPGITVGGKYRLLRLLGEGAMGEVWAAVNESTGGEVALKLLSRPREELRHRLLREARACGKLRHRNVIDIHDVGQTDDGEPFLVMALLHGETLADLIARKRRLETHHAAQIARDIARALTAAHKAGIVHRDLKPANVFLHREEGADDVVVKVLDFGVSKNLDIYDGLSTIAGATVGSPAYMSPEQARTSPDLDHRADLWAVGVVLFEMIAGKRPFEGDAQQVLVKIAMGPIPLVSQLVRNADPGLVALVARCLERDPQKRFASAEELVAELDRFTRPTVPAPAPSVPASSTPAPSISAFNPRTTTQGPRASLAPDHDGPRSRANGARAEVVGEDDQPTQRWNRAMLASMMASASVAPPGSNGDPVDAGAPTLLDAREAPDAAHGHALPFDLPPLGVPPAPRFGPPPPLPDLPLLLDPRLRADPTETPSRRGPSSSVLSSVAPLVHPSTAPAPEAPRNAAAPRAPAPRLWPPLAAALALGAVMVVLALGLAMARTLRARPPVSATPPPNAVAPVVEPPAAPPAPAQETTRPPEAPPPDPSAAPKDHEAPDPAPSATAAPVKPAPRPAPLPHKIDITKLRKPVNGIVFPKLH